ncbi:ankyrin repeat domain-containing protein, partial [Brachyspira pilosicoli]
MKKILLIFVIVLFNVSYLYSKTTIEEDFLSYVVRGDAKKVLYYINDEDVNINYRDVNGVTPLMLSIIAKQNEITQILIKNGANLDLKDNDGLTALFWAIIQDNTEAVRMLINAGANLD